MSIQERVSKWTEDLKANGLRYFVELVVVGLLLLPIFANLYSWRIDRLKQSNQDLLDEVSNLSKQLQEERSKQLTSAEDGKQCSAEDLAEVQEELEKATRELSASRSIAEQLRQQRDRCKQDQESITRIESPPTPSQAEAIAAYDCGALRVSIRGLENIKSSFSGPTAPSFSRRSSLVDLAESHIKELQKSHSDDEVLKTALRSMAFSSGSEVTWIQAALDRARGYGEAFCPELAAESTDTETGRTSSELDCTALALIHESLGQLRRNVAGSSALTSKEQFVDVFNGLLTQAKRTLSSDAFVASLDPALVYGFHPNTKSKLLDSIDLLAGRTGQASATCSAVRAIPPDDKTTSK